MHKFLSAIGFKSLQTRKQLNKLIEDIIQTAEERQYVSAKEDTVFVEYRKNFTDNAGIAVRGEYDEENKFTYDYYYPYLISNSISSKEDVSIERHAEKESYAGICDDIKLGISLIFYLQNVIPYLKIKNANRLPVRNTTLSLSALASKGTVMMPIIKNENQKLKIRQASKNRTHLIEAARQGDETAIESLTLEDMDTYTVISKKIQKEDVFSLVDTYFMPYGVECDQYAVLGEVTACRLVQNKLSQEEIYVMTVNCNEIDFDICINKEDVFGEPNVGRRFKGNIWLQGHINFPE